MTAAVTTEDLSALQIADLMDLWRAHPAEMVRDLFGVEPDPWQEEALEAFPHRPRIAMKACKGPGKALSKTTVIPTPNGDKIWGDLVEGDEIFAEDGTITKVVRTYDLGRVPVYSITFDDGSSATACGDHLWKVQGRTERRKGLGWVVISTKDIVARGVTIPNGRWAQKQFVIPIQGAAQFPARSQPLDPYLVGVWIGDGSRGQPTYAKPYLEVEHEINRRGYQTTRDTDDRVRILSSGGAFRALECFDLGSHERFIPDDYKFAPISARRDLLRGLMDSAGCIGKDGHMEFDSTSKRLAIDVIWLVRSLGGIALIKGGIKEGWYRNELGERVECRDCYRVTLRTDFNPFLIPHKAERWVDPAKSKSTMRYLTRFIASIDPVGAVEAMCIEVDHPSRCYLANDFIVTHNTAVLAWLAWNFVLTREDARIGVTSISGDNLAAGLWTELAVWHAQAPLLQRMFRMGKTEIVSKDHPTTWKIEARTWAKDANAAQIGNALAGLHSKYVMWLLDESGGYPDSILPTCEAIFSGDPIEAHIVQAGNPTHLSGPLYHACTKARDLWYVVTITGDPDDPKRSTRIPIAYAREQIRQYGADNPWVLINIFGQFPPSSLNALIGVDECEAATRRSYREHDIDRSPRILGIDVARYGDDASVMFPRQGLVAFEPTIWRNIDGIQGAGAVARKWSDWDANACFVDDTGGFGASWIDNLRLLGRSPIGVHFAGSALDPRYYNKRAEMYFDAAQWIKDGGQIPNNPRLIAALSRTTYVFKGDRMLLQPKEQVKVALGYSPDEADGFVLTFGGVVAARSTRGRRPAVATAVAASYDELAEVNRRPALGGVR